MEIFLDDGTESKEVVETERQTDLTLGSTNEYKIESDSTGDYSRPLTPLSPANCSEVSFNISEDTESYSFPIHMRSKSAPLDIHEKQTLETIPSNENTPRDSIINTEASPSFNINVEEEEYSSSPLMVIQSLKSTQDDIIEIKPSLELSGNHSDVFHNNTSDRNDSNSLSTPSDGLQDLMEIMFEQLMSNSLNQGVSPTLHSQEIPVLNFGKHDSLEEDNLGQPTELMEGLPISPVSIPEIKVDMASYDQGTTGNSKSNEGAIICHPVCGSSGDSSHQIGTHTPVRYSRPTTPYTSIEDIPSEVDKQDSNDLDDNLIIANKGLFDFNLDMEFENQQQQSDNQLSPTDAHVKRSQSLSLSSQRVVMKKKDSIRKSSHPNKGNDKIEWPSFLKRNHSFKEQRSLTARPISVVGLVHSTRDNSDLLELHDALRRSKRMKPEIIKMKDEDVMDPIMKETSLSQGNKGSSLNVSNSHSRSVSVPAAVTRNQSDGSINDANDHSQPSNKKRDSVDSTGSGKSGRRNRWSIGRSLNRSKRKHSKQDSTTSDEESKCSSISELSVNELPPLSPTVFVENHEDNDDDDDDDDNEIFMKDRASDNVMTTSLDIDEARRLSRVQALARDYSMRIKDKTSASCSPVQEESGSNSPQPSETVSISPAPSWLKDLKNRRRSRAMTVSDTMKSRESITMSLSQPSSPAPPSPHSLRSNSGTPTTIGVPTPTSADTTKTFNFGDHSQQPDSSQPPESSGMQRYSSENVLTKSIDSVLDRPVPQATSKRKRPGWVKYLVKKFNTPK